MAPGPVDRVLAAIETNEGSDGRYPCDNDLIVEATGLSPERVAEILGRLWREGRIEGVLGMESVKPFLSGIRRVLPGRPRAWGIDGYHVEQPG
jgi:hypothetical protein